ncbi:MAG TPA: hypothetical protein VKU85_16935 [bacterium]|nr:hypothetical protein [bacterium]
MRTYGILLAGLVVLSVSPAHGTSLCFVDTGSGNITVEATPQPGGTITTQDIESAWTGFDADGSPCSFGSCGPGVHPYRWTISLSDTDPLVNSGSLSPGPVSLHLWLTCANPEPPSYPLLGLLHVEATGGLYILGYAPLFGAPNFGTFTDLQISTGGLWTGSAPLRVGSWNCWFDSPVGVDATSWSRVKAIYR